MIFCALEDFESEETKSQYCKGLYYTARTDELQKLVKKWVKEDKVEIVTGSTGVGVVQGKG